MKIIISKILLCLFLGTLSLKANDLDNKFVFEVSIFKYEKSSRNKIKSFSNRLKNKFQNLTNVKTDVYFMNKSEGLIHEYVKYQKFNALSIYLSEYLKNQKVLKENTQYYYSFDYKKDFNKYVLIANQKSKINKLKDIKGKVYISSKNSENIYSIWLDYLTLKNLKKRYKYLVRKQLNRANDTSLVLDVFFNKADFTVIRKDIYQDMVLLNPAIAKKVKIIKESKPIFIFGIGMLHKKMPKKMVEIFNKFIESKIFSKEFKYLIKTIGNPEMIRIYPKDLKKLEKFYNEYKLLKSEYK